MTWDELLHRMRAAKLNPIEEIYMENYGKLLAVERPEFAGRYLRCAYGVAESDGLRFETFIFPSEGHLEEFTDIISDIGDAPWWVSRQNVILHFPETDPSRIEKIIEAIS
jgi:hypothetical protein